VIIDVSTPGQYKEGHIKGSLFGDEQLLRAQPEEYLDSLGVDKSKKLILVCETGRKSRRIAETLLKTDYHNVYNLEGGKLDWARNGFNLISDRDRKADELVKPPFLQLDLTAEQLARFKSDRDKFIGELQEMGQAVGKKQIELIDLLAASTPDERAIKIKQEEIQHLQAATQDRVIVHLVQESSLLNPEQRTRFFQLVKARIESSVQAYPPFMRSSGWCRPVESSNE
jgi:rhodanese-related sulfurtransferase